MNALVKVEPARELADVKVIAAPMERATAIRAKLPRQALFTHRLEAAARFGLLMSRREIHERIVATMSRWGEWSKTGVVVGATLCILGLAFLTLATPWLYGRAQEAKADALTMATQYGRGSRAHTEANDIACDRFFGLIFGSLLGGIGPVVGGVGSAFGSRRRRTTRWTTVESYGSMIPDAALLKFEEARSSGLFDGFEVVTPEYQRRERPMSDPWLVGHLKGHNRNSPGLETEPSSIVLAYWD